MIHDKLHEKTKVYDCSSIGAVYLINLRYRLKQCLIITYIYTVLPRNKLTLRFGSGSCGLRFVRFAVAVRAICGCGSCGLLSRFVQFAVPVRAVCGRGSCNLRLRFVRFAVAVRAICGSGSCGLRSRFVQFAVAVRAVCGRGSCNLRFVRFFHRPQKTMASCSDVSRLQRLSYAF